MQPPPLDDIQNANIEICGAMCYTLLLFKYATCSNFSRNAFTKASTLCSPAETV